MSKTFLYFILAFFCLSAVRAEDFPTITTDGNPVWYLIQFMNGGNVFTAENENSQITTSPATGSDAQLWSITGDSDNGYKFTNKKGYTLTVQNAELNNMVTAVVNPESPSSFYIKQGVNATYENGLEIQPKDNSAVSMNLFGGPSENRGVGLWSANDPNNAVRFVSLVSFQNEGKISIIPYPSQLEIVRDGMLDIRTLSRVVCPVDEMKPHLEEFAAQLAKVSGISLSVTSGGAVPAAGEIWMGIDESLPSEGYTLTVNTDAVVVKAASFAGFFYALQTIKQLLPREFFNDTFHENTEWSIPFVTIVDEPAFEHRGFMNDISRHFFDKEEVMRILDIMALYKMNRFHWHLTDDQGWRIEIPEYPLLTEVGAIRSGSFTNPGDGTKFFDDTEYGRGLFYTQEELHEVVAYAKARNIEILPEVDMPGHMVAAVTAYPYLSCDSTKKYSVRLDSGISQDVLNIGDDRVIDFIKCVLDNVAEVFPYPYIHIGGDECPTTQWAVNEDCLRRVREEGLTGVEQLQSWLVEEVGTYLKEKHGKGIVVWDELLSHWNDANEVKPVIMAWNSINKSADAANRGFKSIVSPYQNLYLDFMQVPADKTLIDEPYYGGWGDAHVNTIEDVYNINPVSALPGKEEFCMGVQGNLWAETLNDNEELEYQLLPRLLALSETGWLHASQKNWSGFYKRLQSHDEILDALGYTYAKHYIEPTEKSEYEQYLATAENYLENSIRGGVGYPVAEAYDALLAAYDAALDAKDDEQALTTLVASINAFKTVAIVQPEVGKVYRIVSASTYYKKQYAGSTMYETKNGALRFHYTPQTEPEELWQFTDAGEGYILKNLCSGKNIYMPSINSAVKLDTLNATPVRVDKASIASRNYEFIPGVVTISAVDGYSASVSGSVKRLAAESSGDVYAKDEAALCYPGTWYIVEVADYVAQLEGLCRKCELILITANVGEPGQPTQEALDFLQSKVLLPAHDAVESGIVNSDDYNRYVELYNEFFSMPRTSYLDVVDEGSYYYIRNGWFSDYYAMFNIPYMRVDAKQLGSGDGYLWSVKKNSDGTVFLYNKQMGKAAYATGQGTDEKIKLGKEQPWTLEERTIDGQTGVCIINSGGENAWYINPDTWSYVLTKPFWGACVWVFEKTSIQVETDISAIEVECVSDDNVYYDLQGRKVETPFRGVYVTGKRGLVIIK